MRVRSGGAGNLKSDQQAGVAHPDGDMVTFWPMSDRPPVNVVELPRARGIELTLDKQNFIVSYGSNALIFILVATLEPDASTVIGSSLITGSHIHNWSRGITELFYPGPLV